MNTLNEDFDKRAFFESDDLVFMFKDVKIYQKDQTRYWEWDRDVDLLMQYIHPIAGSSEAFIQNQVFDIYHDKCYRALHKSIMAALSVDESQTLEAIKEHISQAFSDTDKFIQKMSASKLRIIAENSELIVYMQKNGDLEWHFKKKLSDNTKIIFAEVQNILTLTRVLLRNTNRKYKQLLNTNLATALTNSTYINNLEHSLKHLKEIEETIRERATSHARFEIMYFTIYLTFFILSFSILLYSTYDEIAVLHSLTIGLVSGTVGALVSIIQRNDTIVVDLLSSRTRLLTEALSRLLLGMIFGILVTLLIKSEIISLLQVNNNYALCIFGIIAGFSERFVPDYLEKISNQNNSDIN